MIETAISETQYNICICLKPFVVFNNFFDVINYNLLLTVRHYKNLSLYLNNQRNNVLR